MSDIAQFEHRLTNDSKETSFEEYQDYWNKDTISYFLSRIFQISNKSLSLMNLLWSYLKSTDFVDYNDLFFFLYTNHFSKNIIYFLTKNCP